MQDKIYHIGIIESVDEQFVTIRINQNSACSSCSAAQLCSSRETKEKTICVCHIPGQEYIVGQQVRIVGTVNQSLYAVSLAYVLPLILMLLVLFLAKAMNFSDVLAALFAFMSLSVYYLSLRFFHIDLSRKLSFSIE